MSQDREPEERNATPAKKEPYFCRRRKIGIATCATYTLALIAILLLIVPSFFESRNVYSFAQAIFLKNIGAHFSTGQVTFSLFGGPLLDMRDVRVAEENGDEILTADRIRARLDIWHSLKGEFAFSEMTLIRPTIRVERYKKGSFNIPLLTRQWEKRNRPDGGPSLAVGALTIHEGELIWSDAYTAKKPIKSHLTHINITLKREGLLTNGPLYVSAMLMEKKPVPLLVNGALNHQWGSRGVPIFTGDIAIGLISLGKYWPYLAPYLPFESLACDITLQASFNGNFRSGFSSSGSLGVGLQSLRYKQAFSRPLKGQEMTLDYDLFGDTTRLTLKPSQLVVGPVVINGSGKIDAIQTANPRIALRIATNVIDLLWLKQYLPDKALTPEETGFFRRNLQGGSLRLTDFSYNGDFESLRHPERPDALTPFAGRLQVSDVSLGFEKLTYPFENISGEVSLAENRLSLYQVKGKYGSSSLDEISGIVSDIHQENPVFDIYLRADLNLEEARAIFAQKVTSPAFRKRIDMVTSLEGNITLDLVLAGEAAHAAETLTIDGEMTLDRVGMRHASLGLPIRDMSGSIEGSFKDLTVKGLTWRAGSSPFYLTGVLHAPFGEHPTFESSLNGQVWLDDIGDIAFLEPGKNLTHTEGYMTVNMDVAGAFGDFDVLGRIETTNSAFRAIDVVNKRMGLPVIHTFDGAIHDSGKVVIRKLDTTIGESNFEVTGHVGRFLRGEDIDLTITTDGARLDDLDRYLLLLDDIDSAGVIRGAVSLKSANGPGPVTMSGGFKLDNGRFKLRVFESIFDAGQAQLEAQRNRLFLRSAHGSFGEGDFTLSGQVVIGERPTFTVAVTTNRLNLSDLFKEGGNANGAPEPESPEPDYLDRARWDINLHANAGTIGFLTYSDLDTAITFENDTFHVAPFTFLAHGGQWDWTGDVTLFDDDITEIMSVLTIQDLDMKRYTREALGVERKLASGKYTLITTSRGIGSDWNAIEKSLYGSGAISSGPGVIHKYDTISRIFSLLNVSQYFRLNKPEFSEKGMPFDGMSATFTIKDGVVKTEDVVVNSEAINLSGFGSYSIIDHTLDATVAAAPFVTMDRLISAIPVVGYVLAGEDKRFLGGSFRIQGPIADPEVTMEPLQGLARGAAGVLKRLALLPVKAIKALTAESATTIRRRAYGLPEKRP